MASKTKEDENRKKRDPFAYFGGLGDIEGEEDDSESDEDESETASKELSFISKSTADEAGDKVKLPSAEELLQSSVKPEFLKNDNKKDIDWDKYAMDDTKEEEEPIDYSTNAIPPPKNYDPVSEPLKPTIGDTSEGDEKSNLKRASEEDQEDTDTKRTKTNTSDSS